MTVCKYVKCMAISMIVLTMSACSIKPTHTSLKNNELPELVPVRGFVANIRTTFNYKISPDGKKLAWVGTANLQRAVFIKDMQKKTVREINVPPKSRELYWAQDSMTLFSIYDKSGRENRHILKIDLRKETDAVTDITPWQGVKVSLARIPVKDKKHIYIMTNENDKSQFDLYRLDYKTGKKTLLEKNDGSVNRWLIDEHGLVRARSGTNRDKKQHYLEARINKQWKTIAQWGLDTSVGIIGYPVDKSKLLALSNRGRDKVALVELSLHDASEKVLYQHDKVDVGAALVSKLDQKLLVVNTMPDYPQVKIFDEAASKQLQSLLNKKVRLFVSSLSEDERLLTIGTASDIGTKNYLYNRDTGEVRLLAKSDSMNFADRLASVKPFSINSRDGLELNGYLTMPSVKRQKNLPAVLLVHGGPWGRDVWSYNRFAQMLANRGYVVIQVNFRGSRGYGKQFMQAARGEFAGKMHDDLIDVVDWTIQEQITDPERIAIVGFSYGGYATLVGMTQTPEKFACGVDGLGPSELASLIRKFPPYWINYLHHWHRYVGDPDKPEDLKKMQEKSPVYHADKITRPLLILHTENDVRVRKEQADMMVAAMKKANKPVDYIVYKGEGHGFRHWKTRLKLYRDTEDFLAKCLGGRSSGFDFYELGTWMF